MQRLYHCTKKETQLSSVITDQFLSISKVFEKVVYNQLSTYLSTNQLLYGSQHGFRKQHSTETATLELVDSLLQTLDSGKLPISIFLDLSKAFDTLDHVILINKLKHYGISGTPLNWICNYLTDRQQFVQYKGTMSNTRPIVTGVPQGSVLGPLLFIIYINDIHCASNKFKSILYADDTTLVGSLQSFESQTHPNDYTTLSNNINKELSHISEWLNANKLSLNKDKTKYMIHHFSQRDVSQLKLTLNLEGKQIQGICEFNFLGTTIEETLNWAPHTDRIANKISRTLGVMNKLKQFLPTYTLRTMYNSLILPHQNFSILSWGLHTSRLSKLQKRAVRIITRNKYNAHTEPILKYLGLLKVNDIFTLQCLKFYFKCTHGRAPLFFASFFTRNTARHDHNTRQRHQPEILFSHTSRARKCIKFHIPLLLRSIPPCIIDKIYTVSQTILNSTCWPAMKISVKRETATYAPTLKLSCLSSSRLFIYYIYLYHVMYTVYSVSHHIIASVAHVYYSLMFNNVILHMLMFIIHLCL